MNKRLIAERFSKAITTYPKEANVQRQIAGKMIRLLTEHIPSPCSKVIEFGCGTGIYSRMLLQALRPEELLLNDLCPDMKYCCEDLLMKKQVSFLPGDAETVSFPTESTLITSCSALQWFESPENFFERCNTLLNNQGYFAFSTFGKENMKEIRELTGNGLPYRSREELEVALSPHFDILYSEEELIPLSFEDPIKVLYHLKQTGVNGLSTQSSPTGKQENDLCSSDNNSKNNFKNNLPQQQWTRRDLQLFCERYMQEFTQGTSATGFLAREWNKNGHRTITQKFIQTGNVGHSEDIDLHRQIMGIPFTKEDQEGLTMPEIFSYPASPHLASQLDNRPIDFDKIKRATEELSERYDSVLLEGAGGLMVPLTTELLTIDYIVQEKYPLIFVTSGKLGSINHTLLSLEAIQKHGIVLDTVLYNLYPTLEDKTIQNDTMEFIRTWLKKYFPETKFILVPEIKKNL